MGAPTCQKGTGEESTAFSWLRKTVLMRSSSSSVSASKRRTSTGVVLEARNRPPAFGVVDPHAVEGGDVAFAPLGVALQRLDDGELLLSSVTVMLISGSRRLGAISCSSRRDPG